MATYTRNHIMVGGRGGNPAHLSIMTDPVHLEEGMEIAVKSIAYGEIYNVSDTNNCLFIRIALDIDYNGDELRRLRAMVDGRGIAIDEADERIPIFIKNGRYSDSLEVMKEAVVAINLFLAQWTAFDGRRCRLDHPPAVRAGAAISMTMAEGVDLLPSPLGGPLELVGCTNVDGIISAPMAPIPSHTEMCFVYLSIVQNSFINGRKSRIVCVFPIKSDDGYTFFEFKQPTYIPINIRQFSKMELTLKDVRGVRVGMNDQFDTVVTLHMQPALTA